MSMSEAFAVGISDERANTHALAVFEICCRVIAWLQSTRMYTIRIGGSSIDLNVTDAVSTPPQVHPPALHRHSATHGIELVQWLGNGCILGALVRHPIQNNSCQVFPFA